MSLIFLMKKLRNLVAGGIKAWVIQETLVTWSKKPLILFSFLFEHDDELLVWFKYMIKYIHISEADTRGAQLASTSPPTHSFRLSKFFFFWTISITCYYYYYYYSYYYYYYYKYYDYTEFLMISFQLVPHPLYSHHRLFIHFEIFNP